MTLNVLGFAGSLRQESWNHKVLLACQALAPEGMTIEAMRLTGIPIFNEDEEDPPPPVVAEFKRRILAADAILIVTPEYNHGVPGVLKNAIDWGSRPPGQNCWAAKPAAICGATTGRWGTIRSQVPLRTICQAVGLQVIGHPELFIAQVQEKFDAQGTLTDAGTAHYLTLMLETLATWVEQLRK